MSARSVGKGYVIPKAGTVGDDVQFDWETYLQETGGTPAPADSFYQNTEPPVNNFREDMKLETIDPRCPTNRCLATVIQTVGPRLRLRLDGSDSCNDFWVMVDSLDIHPVGYTEKRGGFLLPPLGFQGDSAKWGKYLKTTLANSTLAPEECFVKDTKHRPLSNKFQIGMKLEAVDRKNPFLISPCTVVDVRGDEIKITFDGWAEHFDFWCRYDARDIFPVGWCKKVNHPIQPPPHKIGTRSLTPSESSSNGPTEPVVPPAAANLDINVPSPASSKSENLAIAEEESLRIQDTAEKDILPSDNLWSTPNSSQAAKPDGSQAAQSGDKSTVNGEKTNGTTEPTAAGAKTTEDNIPLAKLASPANAPGSANKTSTPKHSSTKNSSFGSTPGFKPRISPISKLGQKGDSLVKKASGKRSAGVLPEKVSASPGLPGFAAAKASPKTGTLPSPAVPNAPAASASSPAASSNKGQKPDIVITCRVLADMNEFRIYVNHGCECGPFLNPMKVQDLPPMFGPGSVNHLLRECVQALINCASDTNRAFLHIMPGQGHLVVSGDFDGNTNVRHLPLVGNQANTWTYLKEYMGRLGTCPNFLSPNSNGCPNCDKGEPASKRRKLGKQMGSGGPPSGGSGGAEHSGNVIVDLSRNKGGSPDASGARPEAANWMVNDVADFIRRQDDETISSQADLFKKHEIDGKALLLLNSEMIIRYMAIKLGPALKLGQLLDRIRGNKKPNAS